MKRLTFVIFLLLLSSRATAQTNDPASPTTTTTTTAPVTTQTHTIYDDGYANVPLQFAFPYYGQTFTNSWMFSNGIVSFQNPEQSQLSWYNLSVQPFSKTMGSQFNYSIFPLWTDLINLGGTFQTEGSTEFQRYNWVGISPFYDSSRLNTFSVELRPDGKIISNYSQISVNYAGVGMTGDVSKGEYEQIGWYPSTTTTGMIPNWERYTSGPDLCSSNPLSSPACPGFADAMSKLTVVPTASGSTNTVDIGGAQIAVSTGEISPVIDTSIQSATTSQTTASTDTVSQTVAAPIATVTPITTQTTTSATASVSASPAAGGSSGTTNSPNLASALNTIRNNAAREQSIAAQAVQSAISEASAASTRSQQEATSIAATAQSESTGSSSLQSNNSQASTTTAATNSSIGFSFDFASMPGRNDANSQNANTQSMQYTAPTLNYVDTVAADLSASVAQTVASVALTTTAMTVSAVEEIQTSSNMLTDRTNPINDIIDNKSAYDMEARQDFRTDTVKQNVQNNELAGGVDLTAMAVAPQGYSSYMNFVLRDADFYAPKEVYRGQRNVDNARALRGLGSDAKHQEMVNQQYKK